MKITEKKFTVEGYDSFSHESFLVGKYATKGEAIEVARAKGGQMTLMYVLDKNRKIIYRAGTY